MTIRHSILQALSDHGVLSVDEIAGYANDDRRRIGDNLKPCVDAGLVIRKKDVDGKRVAYQITPAGRLRLAEGPQSSGGRAAIKVPAFNPGQLGDGLRKRVAELEAQVDDLQRQLSEKNTSNRKFIGYGTVFEYGDCMLETESAAREEAAKVVLQNPAKTVHVIAILASTKTSITWQEPQ